MVGRQLRLPRFKQNVILRSSWGVFKGPCKWPRKRHAPFLRRLQGRGSCIIVGRHFAAYTTGTAPLACLCPDKPEEVLVAEFAPRSGLVPLGESPPAEVDAALVLARLRHRHHRSHLALSEVGATATGSAQGIFRICRSISLRLTGRKHTR